MKTEVFKRKVESMNVTHYLICNPYSKLGNSQMGTNREENEELFLDLFMVITNKTYERLASVANVVLDSAMNTLFITGYRGCGKTTFSKYLQAVIDSRVNLMNFHQSEEEERKLNSNVENFTGNLSENYKISEERIYNILSDVIDRDSFESIDDCIEFISNTLKGITHYINFEIGINATVQPVEEKLNITVIEFIKNLVINKKIDIFDLLVHIYKQCNKFEIFRNRNVNWRNFFVLIETRIIAGEDFDSIETVLEDYLSTFNTSQLLCVYTLLTLLCADEQGKRVFLILDNIDVVFDRSTLEDFTTEFSLFEENFSELFPEVIQTGLLKNITGFYNDIVYIFVMRETSVNQISDHFTDRLYETSDHFDISKDITKPNIIEKKYSFLAENPTINKSLFKKVSDIRKLCQDFYISTNIFSLFNNDYKRAISCLAATYKFNSRALQYEINLMRSGEPFDKHGARGIVFRLIFNHFKSKRYFEKLGVNTKNHWNHDFTPIRIILTYLNNIQPEHNDQFLADDSDLRSLFDIYENFIDIFSPTWSVSNHILADALWSMYELRKSETWNHLITFDCIASVKRDDLLNEFQQFHNFEKQKSDINIRITCAGRTYVNFVCIHFEFFACRFSNISDPLFLETNLKKDKKGRYRFETIISEVLSAVTKCCNRLNSFTKNFLIEKQGFTMESLLQSKLVHRREDRSPLLHEERVIHQHIGYIEAYRKHLIVTCGLDCIDINSRMIPYIEGYLDLLKDNDLYGETSAELYGDLIECVEYIRDDCKYDNDTDSISRDGAKIIRRKKMNENT